MKSIKKILLSLLFLSACNPSVVFAEERVDTVNVVVPSSINMVFNADGTNTVSEFGVTNNSQLPLTINNIGVTAKNNWDLVSSSTSISKNKRLLNMNINGVELVKGNNLMSIGITEGTKKVIPVSIKRGLWTTNINESAFNLQVDYSFGVKKFTLSFNTDGGTNVNPISANNGSNVVLPTSRKNGKTLEGWVDSSGTLYKPGSNYIIPVGGGTLTAKWRDNKYTVKFDGNGATSGTMSDLNCTYGVRDKLPLNAYVKTGHTFVNWTVRKVVAGETYWLYRNSSDISWFKEGTEPSGYVKHVYEDGKDTISPTDVDGDVITLVAQWSVNSYYLDLGGMLDGSSSMNTNGYGTFDVYIEGVLKAQGVSDYYTLHPYGTNYEVKNIKATTGHTYGGVHSGTLKGSIGEGHRSVRLIFNTNTYSVVYNANGGTGSTSTSTHKYGVEKALSTNGFSRVGYTFEGWNTKPDGSGTNYSNNQLVTNLTSVDKATVTLYSKWKPISYSISYNLNGGTASNVTSYNVETATFTLKNPTKAGYTFTGWTGSNGNVPQTSVSIAKGSTGNKSYTANWKVNNYTVSFNPNGGTVAINTPITLSEFIGVSASGGTLTATSTGASNTDPVTATLNSPFENGVKYELTLSPGARVNFTRQGSPTINGITVDGAWSGNKFTFTYNSAKYGSSSSIKLLGNSLKISWDYLDYGSTVLEVSLLKYGSSYSKSYTYGDKLGTLPSASRNGYTFNGWFTSASGGSKITTTTTVPSNNVTYYAQWTPINYSISYNLNGGSVSGNPTSYNIESSAITLKNPTRSGYIFTGWTGSNGSSAQTSVTIASGSTGNKSYTANWKASDPVVPSVSRVMYSESADPTVPKYVHLSGNIGATASVSDGGTLSYEWDLYYFKLSIPSGGGSRQPVACKVTGLPTNTGVVDVTKIADFYNSDEWMAGSEVDPFQYGDSLHNAIGGYLTVKNTLGGKTVSTKIWVGHDNQTYKNMYASAPRGDSIAFKKSLSLKDTYMGISENNEELNSNFCNTQSEVENDIIVGSTDIIEEEIVEETSEDVTLNNSNEEIEIEENTPLKDEKADIIESPPLEDKSILEEDNSLNKDIE